MKLLIVGLNYAPEPVGIGPYTTGLAEGVAARGHELRVVAGKPYYPQWRPYPGQPDGITEQRENGVTVRRVPHYIPADPTGARRIAHHLSFAARAAAPAARQARGWADLVLAIAPSLLAAPAAARAARIAKAPLWLHFQDFEVEAALATGLLGRNGARIAGRVERAMLDRAALVSMISPQMRARLVDKGVPKARTLELRNWSTVAVPATADGAALRRDWGLDGRTIALYSGNIANKQGLETVIEAARALAGRDDIAFVICGEGPNRARLEAAAAGLPNVHFHDLQPVERLPHLLALADIHLLPQIADAADLVLPSKLTNMLVSGRPVIATAARDTGLAQEVGGCGMIVPPGDPAALAKAVATLAGDTALRHALGRAARQRAAERWSKAAALDTFENAAERLLAARR